MFSSTFRLLRKASITTVVSKFNPYQQKALLSHPPIQSNATFTKKNSSWDSSINLFPSTIPPLAQVLNNLALFLEFNPNDIRRIRKIQNDWYVVCDPSVTPVMENFIKKYNQGKPEKDRIAGYEFGSTFDLEIPHKTLKKFNAYLSASIKKEQGYTPEFAK